MAKYKIKGIRAREILDSRGNPTVEAEAETGFGIFKASVPSGASKGKHEAIELRDGDQQRYKGKGVQKAVSNINTIIRKALVGKDCRSQAEIDKTMARLDGTKNKSKLGANAILAVSMAVCRAGAFASGLSLYRYIFNLSSPKEKFLQKVFNKKKEKMFLPVPSFLLIEGAKHAGNNLDFQEFMALCWSDSFKENLRKGTEIYQKLGKILEERFGESSINTGMEGGYAGSLSLKSKEALDLIKLSFEELNLQSEARIALDCAASSFFNNDSYLFEGKKMGQEELLSFYSELLNSYPIYSLEDPFQEEDADGFKKITELFKAQGQYYFVVGDDLLASNPERIRQAGEANLCNGAIIKPNQIGTITESIMAAKLAKKYNWKTIVSHRSGETNDDFIADFAVGVGADFVKFGAPSGGERVAKYNRLLKIEEELKS